MNNAVRIVITVAALAGAIGQTTNGANAQRTESDGLKAGFLNPPNEARLRMYWRVFGPAWSPDEIDRELTALKQAGVGGVMTYFLYPVALDDARTGVHNQRFGSPEFLTTFGYAARKAREVGLRFGFSGGTGWPFGGPTVTPADSAQHIRMETVTPDAYGHYVLPKLRAGERIFRAFCNRRDVTAPVTKGDWKMLTAAAPLQLLITGPTFMQVKRPAFGGEGLVVDHYSKAAGERYFASAIAPLLQAAPGLVESLYCDSLEVYNANWTPDFPAVFRRARGYDLTPRLPELFDDGAPAAPDLRFDFWRTLAETTETRFTKTLGNWSHQHGVKLEMEAIGVPPNPLTAARYIDLPTGEQYEWKGFSFARFAASGAHLVGRRLIGTEAWTWAGLPNRLADTLSDLKLLSDIHFLSGSNDLTGVDFPYSPPSAGVPGWLPYYGPAIGLNNPQWLCFPDFAAYCNRCQWLLRQGKPVADVAIYLPVEDIFASGPTNQMPLNFLVRDAFVTGEKTDEFGLQAGLRHHSNLIHAVLSAGFNYDGIDFWAMNRLARVRKGRLIAGDGSYNVLILPNLTGIEPDALSKIAQFCREGGTVIATRRLPARAFGVAKANEEEREKTKRVRELVAAMFGPIGDKLGGTMEHPFGAGRAIFAPDDADSLRAALAKLPPDMKFSPAQAEVGFVHRRDGRRDLYFLANVGSKPAQFEAGFRVDGRAAALWNPLDGTIQPLPNLVYGGYTRVALELPSRGSVFIILAPGTPRQSQPATISPLPARSLALAAWRVTFAGLDAPAARNADTLVSWTDWRDAKYFSGVATYVTTFQLDKLPSRCLLHCASIREVAQVVVNGKRAGAIWTPPYDLDIAPFAKAGENTLAITVANLPLNRFLGQPDPDLKSLRAVYGNRFPDPEEKQLVKEPLPSGPIGAVELRLSP